MSTSELTPAYVVELGEQAMERRSRPPTRTERAVHGVDSAFTLAGILLVHLIAVLVLVGIAGLVTGWVWQNVPGDHFSVLGGLHSWFWPDREHLAS